LEIINLDLSPINIDVNDSVTIKVKDSTGTFVNVFGGYVPDLVVSVDSTGTGGINERITITALGALSKLPKTLTNGVLSKDEDGDQIYTILSQALFAAWDQLPSALTWADYDPATTWANAGNSGLGNIDRPGNYELTSRSSSVTDMYSLVAALATSGLGYIYEDSSGRIGYADSTHRTNYLAANGYVDLDANYARGRGLQIQTRVGDVRNNVTIKYDATSSSEESASDAASIALYGELAQIITTTLEKKVDAEDQAAFYLELRANPEPIFSQITFDLTNPEIPNVQRDRLINIFMGEAIALTNLPLNMNSGAFQGFVEGWTFQASYNQLSLTLLLSPLAYSLQAMRWNDVPITEKWNTVSPTLTWESATIVA
jgi:hypothetical protein